MLYFREVLEKIDFNAEVSMSKNSKSFYCNECGAKYPKWLGRCEECGEWNSITEDVSSNEVPKGAQNVTFSDLNNFGEAVERKMSGIKEFDRVLGGGAVAGGVILIGGDPGIGKSTLLLQVMAELSKKYSCVYISGEESVEQICLRAARIGANKSDVKLACETDILSIIGALSKKEDFLVIDSIQTLKNGGIDSIPGTVSQVRSCSQALITYAKTVGTTVFIVGHVTKDGSIAGPKILEHMVDTVLYFEGESGNSYRLLRAVKNRYGPCNELGIFEMQSKGLAGVQNPSMLFLTDRKNDVPGTSIFCGIEGTRPIFVEVQSLLSQTYFPSPRRSVVGWDLNRLFTILAVLESKCGMSFATKDLYLNIAGGLKIAEPACDLAVALSLISAYYKRLIDSHTCVFGEIGLTGEVRTVPKYLERIKEAEKLGFRKVICPASCNLGDLESDLTFTKIATVSELINILNVRRKHASD